MSLTPRTAAAHVGLTPRSIVKAIRAGRLSAEKAEDGDWRIEPEELHRVWPAAGASAQSSEPYLAVRQDEVVAALKAQIEDLRSERDHWRELAHKLAPAGQPAKPAQGNAPAVMAAIIGAVAQSLIKRRRHR
ncbi:MAG: hypothetical protein ACYDD1_04510 [Caulobacteraceae bacterium]